MKTYLILLAMVCGMAHAGEVPQGDVGSNSPELAQLAQDIKDGKYGTFGKRDQNSADDLSNYAPDTVVTAEINGLGVGRLNACWDLESEISTLGSRYNVQVDAEWHRLMLFKRVDLTLTGTAASVESFRRAFSVWITPCVSDDNN